MPGGSAPVSLLWSLCTVWGSFPGWALRCSVHVTPLQDSGAPAPAAEHHPASPPQELPLLNTVTLPEIRCLLWEKPSAGGTKAYPSASIRDVSEGPCQPQRSLRGQPRALLRLRSSLAFPFGPDLLPSSLQEVIPRAPVSSSPCILTSASKSTSWGTRPETPSHPHPHPRLRARSSRVNTCGRTSLLSTRSAWTSISGLACADQKSPPSGEDHLLSSMAP